MIKPLGPEQIDDFIRIRRDSLHLFPYAFGSAPKAEINKEETIKNLTQKNESDFILGYFNAEEELVGIVGCVREKGIKYSHKAFIWGMFVYPEFQKMKIGEQLLLACIEKIKIVPGIQKLTLCATHVSTPALALYKKLGFTIYGEEKNAMRWNDKALDMIYMDLPIS
jgi:ribosomal protein S18 acetylase RimI-like enzyme